MNEDHARYIRARFASAEVSCDPFPHLVVPDVLPPAVYEQLEAICPARIECLASAARVAWRKSRPVLGVRLPRPFFTEQQAAIGFRADPTTPPLGRYRKKWEAFTPYFDLIDVLTIRAYAPATTAYAEQLRRAGFIKRTAPLQIGQGLFTHRTKGWHIPPHVHASAQMIQSMIYFPLPGSIPEQGTVFYRLKGRKVVAADQLARTYVFPDDEVAEAGSMPYRPNTLASFLNTPLAIHASPQVSGPCRRYTFTAAVMDGVSPPARSVDLQSEFG